MKESAENTGFAFENAVTIRRSTALHYAKELLPSRFSLDDNPTATERAEELVKTARTIESYMING